MFNATFVKHINVKHKALQAEGVELRTRECACTCRVLSEDLPITMYMTKKEES